MDARAYSFDLQILLEYCFSLVESAKLVDFVLIFSSDFDCVFTDSGLFFFRELSESYLCRPFKGLENPTIRRCIVTIQGMRSVKGVRA